MSSNSETIVQEVRQELESMLQCIEVSQNASAYEMEYNILMRLWRLGHQLLKLYFVLQKERIPREPRETVKGEILPYHSEKKRVYHSIFGKLPFWRPYFYKKGVGSESPLDEALSLGEDQYSDLLREVVEDLGIEMSYEKSTGLFQRLFGQKLGKQAVQQMVEEDADDVLAYYEQKPVPVSGEEGALLVIQSDGKGVPMVKATEAVAKVRLKKGEKRSKKRESVVTSVYTIDPNPRIPEEVVASLFREERPEQEDEETSVRSRPQHKEIWATLDGKAKALERLRVRTARRDGIHITARVALTDGAQALQAQVLERFPDFTLILDFIHANEYLWDVANRLFAEPNPEREVWMRQHTLDLLSGRTEEVIAELRSLAEQSDLSQAQRTQLHKTANYFERNLEYMAYHRYLAKGWPIASGVIEGACRHLVKDRLERAGMRWTQEGAESLLRLRAVAENGDWEDYHAFRRKQRHLRLYGTPFRSQQRPESAALEMEDGRAKIIDFQSARRERPRTGPISDRCAA